MSTNRWFGHGRLVRDVDMKEAKGGELKVGRFSIAVSRDGKVSDFISCVVYGRSAEIFAKFCHKGSEVIVEGPIRTGSFKNKDGATIYTTDVMVDRYDFCGPKKTDDEDNNAPVIDDNPFATPTNRPAKQAVPDFTYVPEGDPTELPFG